MRVLIIEDEELSQQELIFQLEKYPNYKVIQCVDSIEDSLEYLQSNQSIIDLIFMDIALADGTCFEIFKSIEVEKPIIFLTAYNQYALQAFKVNSIDYLLKPLNPVELNQTLIKFEKLNSREVFNYKRLIETFTKESNQRILAQVGDTFQPINFRDILLLKSEDKYVTIHTNSNKEYLINKTLNKLELELSQKYFFRVNRQFIININAIDKISKYLNNRLVISLIFRFDDTIIVSRNRVNSFLLWMGK
ncbi:MAG: hypothetical protein BM557_07290 [Flavobacterium sp. MedPE-SWcel]|uniref:LytR/AlgR family response regulator transcription factor n=1 Tax=uncultured Flavobacterium sp. TaxID=165435 RepID=UPI0009181E8F|nr:LytTR family DNA-binding domain-containing protein [uncultured Flavobacterium sp.]OIQ18716.1 MAG: hypothetical protein BM557_07290 [Flavobacterium sp. MedPE-SWcel]